MKTTLSWCFAILPFVFTYHAGADEFWLNEIATVTTGTGFMGVDYEVELVVSTENAGAVTVTVQPYHPSNTVTFENIGLVKQSESGSWNGLYVTTRKFNMGYFPVNGSAPSGLLLTYGNTSRMYCWGEGVTTATVVGDNTCESIITSNNKGLNTGVGSSIAYALYNRENTPEGGGSEESHFEWLESKYADGTTFGSMWKVNACPSSADCGDLRNQVIAGGGGEPPAQLPSIPPPSESTTEFWLNEIVTITPVASGAAVQCEVELVASIENVGNLRISVTPYHPNVNAVHSELMEKKSESSPWNGLYVTTIKFNSGYFPDDGVRSGMLVTHDSASRMYCWGEGVSTSSKVGNHQCESIITDDNRGLNGGPGTNIGYGLYNKDNTPPDGGSKESDFQWLESKIEDGTTFESLGDVNTCPSSAKCPTIQDQVFVIPDDGAGGGDGDGGGEGEGGGDVPSGEFWLNEISTITGTFQLEGRVELVLRTDSDNAPVITVEPYSETSNTSITESMQKRPDDDPWRGSYTLVMKYQGADFFPADGANGGVLVKYGESSRMYCWGVAATTETVLGGNKCDVVITTDRRGLNGGPNTSIGYGLYNKADTPPSGGSQESHFQWLESKTNANVSFSTMGKVTCLIPNDCPGIIDQVIASSGGGDGGEGDDGDGGDADGDEDASAGWRPTLSIVFALSVLAALC